MAQTSIFASIQDTLQAFISLIPASSSSHNLLNNDPYQPGDDEIFDVNIWEETKVRNILYEIDDMHKVKCASFNQLIIHFIEENEKLNNNNELEVFLSTYQSFTTSNSLLKKLIQRYTVPRKADQSEEQYLELTQNTQMKVIKFISKWIEECFKEFTPSVLLALQNFIVSLPEDSHVYSNLLSHALSAKLHPPKGAQSPHPESKVPHGLSLILSLSDIDNEELARQMTLIDFESFSSIKDREWMNGAWAKAFGEHRAPHVIEMRNRGREIRKWIISTIVRENGVKERAAWIMKFLEIAEHMLRMNNFNGFCAIVSSLNSITITRLHHTFEALSRETFENYKRLSTIASENHGHKAIRDLEATAQPPGILLIEPILVELTFIEDSQNDYDGKLIRFCKRRMIYDVIHPLQKFQITPYNFTPVYRVSSLLQNWSKLLNDREQYEMSLQREP